MLRVLYKVSPESAQKQGGASVDKKVAKGPESGAQKVAAKKTEAAFKAPRAQKAKEASKREDDARARQILANIDDDVTSGLRELQEIEAQRVAEEKSGKPVAEVRSTPKTAKDYDDASVEKLIADLEEMENRPGNGQTGSEVAPDHSAAESIELDLSDALDAEPSIDELAARDHAKKQSANVADKLATLLETDEKPARVEAINRKAAEGKILLSEDFDDLDALLNAELDKAAAPPKTEAKVALSPTMQLEAAALKKAEAKAAQPSRTTEILPLNETPLPTISENLPPGEREDQLMSLRRTLQAGTEAEYQQLLALEEAYDRALPGPARDALEHQTIALRGRIDQRVRNEFYADHDSPAEAQKYYAGLAKRKAELLRNAEARRVLEKIDEQRGEGGWARGEYITPEIIDGFAAGGERDLARAWHRLEHDQAVMANGVEQIRAERQARMEVDKLQFKLIRNGENLGIPADVVAAFQNPNVNRGDLSRVADQVLVNLDKYDKPQNFGERVWSFGLAIAKAWPFKSDSLFGRKRANAEVNALQIAKDDHDALMRMRQAGKNGPILERGSGAPGFMIATDFGSSFRRGPAESGVSVSGGRRGEQEPGISPEQPRDLQGILSEAQEMAQSLQRAPTENARNYLLEGAEEVRANLESRLLKYVDTPAARSRAYELANQQLQDLEEAITGNLPDAGWAAKANVKKAETPKKSLADIQKMVDEAKWEFYDDEPEDLTSQLEEVVDQASPSDRFIDSPTINEGRGRTLQGLGPDQQFVDSPTLNERTIQDDRTLDGQSRFMDTLRDGNRTMPDGTPMAGRAYDAYADTQPGSTATMRGERFEGLTAPELLQRATNIRETLNRFTDRLNQFVDQNDPVDGEILDYAATYIGDARRLVTTLRQKNLLQNPQTIALSKAIARAIAASRDSRYEAQ